MLTTHDIGNLFKSMHSAYGWKWNHDPEDIPDWRKKLSGSSSRDITRASDKWQSRHPNEPPTLPQFVQVLHPPALAPRPGTYRKAQFRPRAEKIANRILIKVILEVNGVDLLQLRNLVDLKNALVEELGDDRADKKFVEDMHAQLSALAKLCDRRARTKETIEARRQFCARQGMAFR